MKKYIYEWRLRAYTYDPNDNKFPYCFIDDWRDVDADEDKISSFTLKDFCPTNFYWNEELPISHYEIELVRLKVDDWMEVKHSYCWVNKNGNFYWDEDYGTGFKPPKRFVDQIKKWEHLDFYKNQYIET